MSNCGNVGTAYNARAKYGQLDARKSESVQCIHTPPANASMYFPDDSHCETLFAVRKIDLPMKVNRKVALKALERKGKIVFR